jgi:hypothetical protein
LEVDHYGVLQKRDEEKRLDGTELRNNELSELDNLIKS